MKISTIVISSAVGFLATSAMAGISISTTCPDPKVAHFAKNTQGKFIALNPDGTTFEEKFDSGADLHKTVGTFSRATGYLPAYHNEYGQIACDYTSGATLWLVRPTQNARIDNANGKWSTAGKNAYECGTQNVADCKFTFSN